MLISPNSTIAEIKALPADEQLDALASIWDTIAVEDKGLAISKEEQDLLEHRLAQDQDKPGVDWETLKTKILANFK